MKSGNRPEIPPLHVIARMAMRIVVTLVVIGGAVVIASYFALGRPDALFAGGAFPQLVSGARNLSTAPPDSALASILRIAVIGAMVALIVLIGAAGVWDAWQSRQGRGHSQPSETRHPEAGAPASGAWRGSVAAPDRRIRGSDAGSPWSPESTRLHTPREERASTGPDTLQGGTA